MPALLLLFSLLLRWGDGGALVNCDFRIINADSDDHDDDKQDDYDADKYDDIGDDDVDVDDVDDDDIGGDDDGISTWRAPVLQLSC